MKNREVLFHLQADDYDYLPVEGWWVDNNDKTLPFGQGLIPQGNGFQSQSPPYGENRSWLCYPGWREYHLHQSHYSPPWSSFRGDNQFRIAGIIMQLYHNLNKDATQAQ